MIRVTGVAKLLMSFLLDRENLSSIGRNRHSSLCRIQRGTNPCWYCLRCRFQICVLPCPLNRILQFPTNYSISSTTKSSASSLPSTVMVYIRGNSLPMIDIPPRIDCLSVTTLRSLTQAAIQIGTKMKVMPRILVAISPCLSVGSFPTPVLECSFCVEVVQRHSPH